MLEWTITFWTLKIDFHINITCQCQMLSFKILEVSWCTFSRMRRATNTNYESPLWVLGRKQVEEFLNVVGIIFPIKHWNCADNQNDSGRLAESSFQWNTRIILQVNCFVLRSTKQFTYRMILVFHWNDDSAKRPESFWSSVSKQHNSNVLLERWF